MDWTTARPAGGPVIGRPGPELVSGETHFDGASSNERRAQAHASSPHKGCSRSRPTRHLEHRHRGDAVGAEEKGTSLTERRHLLTTLIGRNCRRQCGSRPGNRSSSRQGLTRRRLEMTMTIRLRAGMVGARETMGLLLIVLALLRRPFPGWLRPTRLCSLVTRTRVRREHGPRDGPGRRRGGGSSARRQKRRARLPPA